MIVNDYDAGGRKLRSKYFTLIDEVNIPVGGVCPWNEYWDSEYGDWRDIGYIGTSYVGNHEYMESFGAVQSIGKRIHNPEGYSTSSHGVPHYHYYRKDHLGNNREVWRDSYTSGSTTYAAATERKTQYYPSGLPWKTNSGDTPESQPYKYGGKEFVEMHGLDEYDSEARWYYPAIMRTTTMDPLAEKYYNISPYAWCGNNPVKFVDPDGREWKEKKDEEIAKQLQQQIANRDKSLAKQEQKINAQIDKIGNNTKLSAEKRDQQIAKQQGKLENVQTQRTLLSNLDKGITQLGDSKTSYTFNTVETGTTATLSSMSDGTVVINNYGTIGNRAHETTHAMQYDNGKISFEKLGSNVVNFNADYRGLEIQAYATEYSITNGIVPSSDARYPRTVFGISLQWLYGIKDPNTGIYIYRPENYK